MARADFLGIGGGLVACFVPTTDVWGASAIDGLYIAGDGVSIGGAKVAALSGEICAVAIDARLRGTETAAMTSFARGLMRARARAGAIRPFLDARYRPGTDAGAISDRTIVCRCENVTAGQIRQASLAAGTDTIKMRTRAGMGMCQGRQCGYVLSALLAEQTGRHVSDLECMNVRPPLKPIALGELAASMSA